MNSRTLNRELAAARGRAAALEPLLVKAWAAVIEALAQRAATAFASGATIVAAAGPPPWQPPPDDALFPDQSEKAAAKTRRARERVLAAAADIPSITFDVSATAATAFLESLGPRTDTVIAGIQPAVLDAIQTGYEQGLSVPDTAALIRSEVAALKDWQASALARTDLNALANGGNHLAVQQLNASAKDAQEQEFRVKTWRTAEDDRVREAHEAADGQTVPIDQPFTVDGEALQHPGDPIGSPENTWNCRCVVTYAYDEAAARALSRNQPALQLAASAATVTEDETGGAMKSDTLTAASVTVITEDAPSADVAVAQAWSADLAFEGVPTDDGRWMAPGSLTWREPPMTLLALTENTESGHLGADSAGSIQTVEKSSWTDPNTFVVRGTGVFDLGEFGQETARMVGEGTLGYVSVDLAVREDGFRNPDTGEILDPATMTEEQWMEAFMGGLQYAVLDGVIGAATVVPFSAFADSRISMSASGEKYLKLRAPILLDGPATLQACAAGPLHPSAEWFAKPKLKGPTLLTATPEGRVFGHAATWDCHTGFADRCLRASPSRNGYAMFHCGQIQTAEGELVRIGRIIVAPHSNHSDTRAAMDYYDDAGRVAAFVRAYDDEYGIAVAGVTRSDAPPELLRDFLANPPSGDWRRGELLGFSSVPNGGLPVIVPEARLVASADGEMIVDWLRLPPVTMVDVLLAAITGDEPEDAYEVRRAAEAAAEDIVTQAGIAALAGAISGE